jgi:hypothetical protein
MISKTNLYSLLSAVCIAVAMAHEGKSAIPIPGPSEQEQRRQASDKARPKSNSNTKVATPTPTPTPPPTSTKEERQILGDKVEAAIEEVLAVQGHGGADRKQIIALQKRVTLLNQKLRLPETSIEDLRVEANDIVTQANRIREESRPSFLAGLIGSSLPDYLARVAILILLLLAVCMLALLLRLRRQIERSNSWLNKLGQKIDLLKDPPSRVEAGSGPPAVETHEKAYDLALDSLSRDFHAFKDEIHQFLERLQNTGSLREQEDHSEIPISEEVRPDLKTLATTVYVSDFLEHTSKDRQISVRYEIANENFVIDPVGKLIVITGDAKTNEAILLPKASRLNSPDQFDTYYTQAYDCERLTLGSLFILTPAVVNKASDGWKLATRGTLELKA